MEKLEKFDLAIIGAGPGGYEAAAFAAKHGLKTAIIEKNALGGTCLNSGCIPTKTLLHTADLYQEITAQASKIGLSYSDLNVDMGKMQERKQEVITLLQEAIAKLLKAHKVTVFKGLATITDKHQLTIKNTPNPNEQLTPETITIQADKILITSGSTPAIPPIEGANYTLTSDKLLNETKIYDSLIIIGGGVIGIEFASLYTSLGKKVIVIEALDRILANMDKEFAQSLKMQLTKKGAQIHTKALVNKIAIDSENPEKITCYYTEKNTEQIVSADAVLMAVGRKANSAQLWTNNVDISTEKGKIQVNESYQTTCENIYAAGDVIGGIQLAHTATAEAINAVCHILNIPPKYDTTLIPSCIYTNPEIASVGITADEAKKLGIKINTIKYPMGANGKTLLSLQERGFIKIIADAETKQILGAQMMCARATDMISQFTQAIANNLTTNDLAKIIYPHPTFNEAIGKCLE